MSNILRKTLIGATAAAGVMLASSVSAEEIKVTYGLAETSYQGAAAKAWQEVIEANTDFTVRHFSSSALGGEREMVEGVQLGTIDMAVVSSGTLSNFVPEVGVFDIPFLFRGFDHARAVLDGPIGEDILAKFPDAGLIALAWGEQGFRHITNSRGPIHTPQDMAGLKLRTMENPTHIAAFKAIGAAPTPMAWPEVITSLQQGAIDGQENPLSVIVSQKLSEVQSYLTLSGHVYSPAILLMSTARWDGLSDAQKAVFKDGAKVGAAAMRSFIDDVEQSGADTLKSQGMQVNELSSEEKVAFQASLESAYVEYSKTFGDALINSIIETN